MHNGGPAASACLIYRRKLLQVNLVSLQNKLYAPTVWFPVLLAFQKPERARFISPAIYCTIRDAEHGLSNGGIILHHMLRGTNWSSYDP